MKFSLTQKRRKSWRAQARRPKLSFLASYLKMEDVLLSATVWRSTGCTVNLQRSFQHGKNVSSKAVSLIHLQVSQFEDTLHLRQKETITGLLSALLPAPAMRLNSPHSLNSFFQLLSNALTAFPAPTPFLNKSACFSIIRGVRSKSGVLAFLRNQYFLPARWLSFWSTLNHVTSVPSRCLTVCFWSQPAFPPTHRRTCPQTQDFSKQGCHRQGCDLH